MEKVYSICSKFMDIEDNKNPINLKRKTLENLSQQWPIPTDSHQCKDWKHYSQPHNHKVLIELGKKSTSLVTTKPKITSQISILTMELTVK